MKRLPLLQALFLILLLTGCSSSSPASSPSSCTSLATSFDDNTPFLFTVLNQDYQEIIVGGTLLDVSEPYYYVPEDKYQAQLTYALTFKGKEKEEVIYLRTNADKPFSYKVGIFYTLNLSNIRPNGYLSGSFFDPDMDRLQAMHCP